MSKKNRISINPAPMSPELVKNLYESMTEEGKEIFVSGFHIDDREEVRRIIERPIGWFVPVDQKHVQFVAYNRDTAHRSKYRDNYIGVYTDAVYQKLSSDYLSVKAMESILEEIGHEANDPE